MRGLLKLHPLALRDAAVQVSSRIPNLAAPAPARPIDLVGGVVVNVVVRVVVGVVVVRFLVAVIAGVVVSEVVSDVVADVVVVVCDVGWLHVVPPVLVNDLVLWPRDRWVRVRVRVRWRPPPRRHPCSLVVVIECPGVGIEDSFPKRR